MKLSVTPYTFHQEFYRGEMDVFHLIETIKCRYHLNAVDMWNPQLESITDEAYLKRVKAALDANDLIVNNYAMDGANLWDPDPEIRKRNVEFYRQNAKAAEILGAKSVKVDTGSHYLRHFRFAWDKDRKIKERNYGTFAANPVEDDEYWDQMIYTDEMIEYFQKVLKEYCDRAANMGYDVYIENHWATMCVASELKKVMDACAHPNLGVLAHLGRWFKGDTLEAEKLIAPYTRYVHVDLGMAEGGIFEHGKPYLDAGFDGYWGVEYTGEGENSYACAEYQLAAIKRLLSLKK